MTKPASQRPFDRGKSLVNRDRIAAARKKHLAAILEGHGSPVTISGKTFSANVSLPQSSADLGIGGFDPQFSVRISWPYGVAPVPAIGTAVLLVDQNLSFRVDVPPVIRPGALGQEVHVTATRE